jgi:site-specific recombinase XerD
MRRQINFDALSKLVLDELGSQGYQRSTLTIYRRIYNRVHSFINERGSDVYTEEDGRAFIDSLHVADSTLSTHKCAIRRLDDCINEKPYRCHHDNPEETVPEIYAEILEIYLTECRKSGNKPLTLDVKRKACIEFLRYISRAGCTGLSDLDSETVSKALLIYANRDMYAIVRMFLRYLAENKITQSDLSGIVPRYKRRKPLPTTYTPNEIRQLEDSIDTSTATGKRNLAIIRLATRMGLRSGDIAKLKLSEIDFYTGYISFTQEKTGQPLSLQMPQAVSEALLAHIENIKDLSGQGDGYLFHSMTAPYGKITTSIIRHAVTECFNATGISTKGKKHGPHSFRSSLASSMVNDGGSYEAVRRILGHTDPDTIKHYAKTDIENLRLCSISPPAPSGLFEEYLSGEKVICHV